MALSRRDFLYVVAGVLGTGILPLADSSSDQQKEARSCAQETLDEHIPTFIWNLEYSFEWTTHLPYSLLRKGHISPVEKYSGLHEKLAAAGIVNDTNTVPSCALTEEDFLLVHTQPYLERLEELAHSHLGFGSWNDENPLNQEILEFVKASCSGTYHAAQAALQSGRAMNLSGGFHHAFPDHEEGFCYLNDVAIAVRKLQQEGRIKTALIIDGDVHHGNGNAFIFKDDPSVFILDTYQRDNYPELKIPVEQAVVWDSSEEVTDQKYLAQFLPAVQDALARFTPDIVFYLDGADPLATDKLGGFKLTVDGLRQRDEYVIRTVREREIPLVVVLAGGYSSNIGDVVQVHFNCAQLLQRL